MKKDFIFYRDKPIFGFDLGYSSIKLMQVEPNAKGQPTVQGYGFGTFDHKAVKDGVIIDPELIAKEVFEVITKKTIGDINTKRVAASMPAGKTFSRVLTVPTMDRKDLDEAVRMEAEQYIPVRIEDLYIDYEIADRYEESMEVLVVATPKKVVDSYLTLFELLNLEPILLETTISASTRLVIQAEQTDSPTLIIDFGSVSTDLSLTDTILRVTGSVNEGGATITQKIAKSMGVTERQAQTIKTKYGLLTSKKQKEITEAVEPILNKMVVEIKKMVRFYQERSREDKKLEQVIILGGGANMPGLSDYLTDHLRLPTRMLNPWNQMSFGDLQPPHKLEKTLFATAAGLSLADPKEAADD